MTQDAAGGDAPGVDSLLAALQSLTTGRDDLTARLTAAAARATRPATIICVVGEFKQGKSSLVNAMVGGTVCPVDDDLATSAITLVRHADDPVAIVRTRTGGKAEAVRVHPSELRDYVTEAGNPNNRLGVERVEVGVPSALLSDGLCIVDTPGVGSLGAGHAAATLAFIPFADGLVFVSDTTSELTAPELAFLAEARALCPTVMVVQPKTDLAPQWRRIVEINEGHLERAGIDCQVWPVSSALRAAALRAGDQALAERSGFPAMLDALRRDVIVPAKQEAAARAAREGLEVIDQLRVSLEREQTVLTDPQRHAALVAEAEEAVRRLEQLRGPGARWSTVLGDRIADLNAEVNHQLRAATRDIIRSNEERIESLKTAEEWDTTARELQTAAADCVLGLFRTVEERRLAVRTEIAGLIGAEHLAAGGTGGADLGGDGGPADVSRFWRDRADPKSGAGSVTKTGLTGLRGVQTGVLLLGTLTQFLPAAAATLLATNPVLLTVGAAFGGFQVLEDRSRKLMARRQAARTQLRQFIDDLTLEVGNDLAQVIRETQRQLRDEFGERIAELQRTFTESARQARAAAESDDATRDQRLSVVGAGLQRGDTVERLLTVHARPEDGS